MPRVGLEPATPVFDQSKKKHTLHRTLSVIGKNFNKVRCEIYMNIECSLYFEVRTPNDTLKY